MTLATQERPATDLITRIESEVASLPEIELTPDGACLMLDTIEGGIRRLKAAKESLEAHLIEWLPKQPVRELVIGDIRIFVADKKREKCRGLRDAVMALYEATGGDYDAFVDCLSANAIKYGAARKVLGEQYGKHFETIVEKDLDSKPVKVLAAVNDRFVR